MTPSLSRRHMLLGTGVAALGATAVACSADDPDYSIAEGVPADGGREGNTVFARLAVSMEVQAIATYQAAITAANGGALGFIPLAVKTYLADAKIDHEVHRDAWTAFLVQEGQLPVDEPHPGLKATIDQQLPHLTDTTGAANLALMLEQTAADTYLEAIPALISRNSSSAVADEAFQATRGAGDDILDPVKLTGQCQITGQQHAATLLYVLGTYPVPDVFQSTDEALTG